MGLEAPLTGLNGTAGDPRDRLRVRNGAPVPATAPGALSRGAHNSGPRIAGSVVLMVLLTVLNSPPTSPVTKYSASKCDMSHVDVTVEQ